MQICREENVFKDSVKKGKKKRNLQEILSLMIELRETKNAGFFTWNFFLFL